MPYTPEAILTTLTILELPSIDLERLDLPHGPLELQRAWPRTPYHLGLEYVTSQGSTVVGQWFGDVEQLERVAQATARSGHKSSIAVVNVAESGVLLQTNGADRRLPGLAPLLAQHRTHLLVHRPERRAVVRIKRPTGLHYYAKVVRPKRSQALAAASRTAAQLAGGAFLTPELHQVKAGLGVLFYSALPGVSLYELSSSRQLVRAGQAAGRALRALHTASPPVNINVHRAVDEAGVLQKWLDRLEVFIPNLGTRLRATMTTVCKALAADTTPSVPLHRDFYDKQVFIDADGHIGLLDFDTMAIGEAALDLANALVHFELRALQGHCPPSRAIAAMAALLDGYRLSAGVSRRLNAYADASRLRLACVYAFRPYGAPLVPQLLTRVGRPIAGVVK